jgi:hypothetical protein
LISYFEFYIDVIVSHAVVYTHSLFKVVSYTTNPAAGELIAFFCVVVIRGGRKPLVVDDTFSKADATSVVEPIITLLLVPLMKKASDNKALL